MNGLGLLALFFCSTLSLFIGLIIASAAAEDRQARLVAQRNRLQARVDDLTRRHAVYEDHMILTDAELYKFLGRQR